MSDLDTSVVALAAQPFPVTGEDHGVTQCYLPDLLLVTVDRRAVVVDVKPAGLVEDPRVREQFAWTRRLCGQKGRGYEVFSEASPVMVRNIRFLASGRRPELLPAGLLDEARQVAPGKATAGTFLVCRLVTPAPEHGPHRFHDALMLELGTPLIAELHSAGPAKS